MLQSHTQSAGRTEDANSPRHPKPARQRSIEIEDKGFPHIPFDPFIEYLNQELSPLVRPNGSVRNLVAFLESAFVIPLYDRNELYIVRIEFVPEETINIERMACVFRN